MTQQKPLETVTLATLGTIQRTTPYQYPDDKPLYAAVEPKTRRASRSGQQITRRQINTGDDPEIRQTQPTRQTERLTHTEELQEKPRRRGINVHSLLAIGAIGALSILLLYIMVVGPVIENVSNHWHYGDYNQSYTSGDVGHGGTSEFLGFVNGDGQMKIVEVTATSSHVYVIGTIVLGAKHPVLMHLQDINGDGSPDLIIHEGEQEYVLYNNGKGFQREPIQVGK